MLNKEEIMDMFTKSGALLNGHFLLTSGLHSPNYFQCAKVLQYPSHMTSLCSDIANKLGPSLMDVIVGPAIGGIVVAQEVGRLLNKRTIFAERDQGEMTLRRGFEIAKGERVVIVEDVLTTGKSINEVCAVVEKQGGVLAGVAVIVDRSRGTVTFPVPLHSLMAMDVVTYDANNCPLCQEAKVPLIKPGSRAFIK
ncbi:MAG: orotate phosphoribosyltransferase [Candidatus Raymondbacteria bacterium RifOxyA12_full_50_37]|uniref:Orotate phosphoribosyltransferase n=1 Tax=Candidatus Raymondbacteria bacterium RIFOXYD12_FULL_49_13 TaxID=1817890 RepID=A0A1F7F1M3_UNCRA|nr:MAG: orotate phosphoribosyltransferase [Candidatus Raymondbacteria bacterium RifOxyA12_full_50_37]OGJ93147.1 MAG: orotate phosphoribosyltransferase [Candidatus Raymondbacteria bacterium RifOxyB12_full_50_8]OGJ93901.1 MAG: orotate phosphoribosyltransferase [Candidatus Raymondbacteria bacterium RIFOXYA2_FULL_49_16]OGJ98230.1 MAG: orotate phosphoribosyltransferase [Candidatus Raymondbacteria bacterium RIFOXYC2_FULL_50_21]OGK00463.1 MAG: orotate phosphoribosyltransferase [Candidatus Raymondbacte